MSSFRLESVTVRYEGLAAVDDVSLAIADGERVAFVGPSGSGKTTLLNTLNGAVRPTAGRVFVDGADIGAMVGKDLRRARGRIGFVHQALSLVPVMRAYQNVVLGRLGRQSFLGAFKSLLWPSRDELQHVHEILERVGIPEKLYQRTDRLSGGQQQRVAIARALYQQPAALLADEPVASVDPARARATVELLKSISEERELTLCMSLHNLDLARRYFPRLVGLREGRIAFDKPASEITDEEFESLYRLDESAILANGT